MNCLLCNRPIKNALTLAEFFSFQPYNQQVMCQKCTQTFLGIQKEKMCPGCARTQENNKLCLDCSKWCEVVSKKNVSHHAFYQYNPALKDWLHTYKIKGDTRMAVLWKNELRTYYRQHRSMVIVPIPISNSSLQARGFNQCIEMLRCADVPYVELLENISQGQKQSKKNRYERLESDQPFRVLPKKIDANQPVLLFDDLYTTGRTLMHAKEVLCQTGIRQVYSLTIGR